MRSICFSKQALTGSQSRCFLPHSFLHCADTLPLLPPFPKQVESALQSKPLNGAAEEDGLCVLISKKHWGEQLLAQVTSAQMELAGKRYRLAWQPQELQLCWGMEPDEVGETGAVPHTPECILQCMERQWGKAWLTSLSMRISSPIHVSANGISLGCS